MDSTTYPQEKKKERYERIAFELSRAFRSFRSAQMPVILFFQIAVFFFAWSKGAGAVYRDMVVPLLAVTAILWIYTSVVRGSRRILICCLLLLTVGTMLQCLFIAEKGGGGRTIFLNPGVAELQLQYFAGVAAALAAGILYYRYQASCSVNVCRGLVAAALVLSLTALIYSSAVGDVRNWIRIGSLSVQTTELVKPVYLMSAAALLGTGETTSGKQIAAFEILTAVFAGIMILQGEFGTLLLLLMVFSGLFILFIPDKKRIIITDLCLAGAVILFVALGILLSSRAAAGNAAGLPQPARIYLSSFTKVRNRFVYWLHPEFDPQGLGYQLLRAKDAIFLGGWFGTGSLTDLPVETSDLVYPALIERCGLIFALAVFILYICLWLEGVRVSVRKSDRCHKVIAAGSAYFLFDQTLIIIAGSTGLCPLTGITLPFISGGGTSLLVSFVLVVLLITASGNVRWKGEDIEEKEFFAQSTISAKLHAAGRSVHAYIHRKDISHTPRPVKKRRSEED